MGSSKSLNIVQIIISFIEYSPILFPLSLMVKVEKRDRCSVRWEVPQEDHISLASQKGGRDVALRKELIGTLI